jgi:hypothetical protein
MFAYDNTAHTGQWTSLQPHSEVPLKADPRKRHAAP